MFDGKIHGWIHRTDLVNTAMQQSHWTYYLEFFTMPPIALVLAAYAFLHSGFFPVAAIIIWGYVFWSLLEYIIHRFAFHHWPYFSDLHNEHHKEPKSFDKGPNTILVHLSHFAAWCLFYIAVGAGMACAGSAGIMLGYYVYIVVHYRLHHHDHTKFGPWMSRLWNLHASHHRGGHYDFGVTTSYWDDQFGTRRPT